MKAIWPCIASLFLFACGQSAEQEPGETAAEEPVAEQSASPVTSLAGHWRVAAIDGEGLEEPYGLALAADDAEIWWEPRCAYVIHPYKIDGGIIAVTERGPAPASTPGPDGEPVPAPMICTIATPPRLPDVNRALINATQIERTPENGILLSGGGHSLLLFSQ